MQSLPGARHHRAPTTTRKPVWIIMAVVSLITMFVIGGYVFPHHRRAACYLFSSKGCKGLTDWLPPSPRELSDDEVAARVVIREILSSPRVIKKTSKIAFMFLTPGTLPFEKLWDLFFQVKLCLFFSPVHQLVVSEGFVLFLCLPHRVMRGSFLCISMHRRIRRFTPVVTFLTVKFEVMRYVSLSLSLSVCNVYICGYHHVISLVCFSEGGMG